MIISYNPWQISKWNVIWKIHWYDQNVVTVGCNWLSLPLILASGAQVPICCSHQYVYQLSCCLARMILWVHIITFKRDDYYLVIISYNPWQISKWNVIWKIHWYDQNVITVGCNWLSLPLILASGAQVPICCSHQYVYQLSCCLARMILWVYIITFNRGWLLSCDHII